MNQTTSDPITAFVQLIEDLTLPAGVHAEALHVVTCANHATEAVVALWGNATHACPGCRQTDRPVVRSCPVSLDPSMGEVQAFSQQHGCGSWWGPRWETVVVGDDEVEMDLVERINEKAEMVAEDDRQRDADLVEATYARLRRDLSDAVARLIEGYDDVDYVVTGGETGPGVWYECYTTAEGRQTAEWESWDYDPSDPRDEDGSGGGTLTVTVHDLDGGEAIAAALDAVLTYTDGEAIYTGVER